MITIKPLTTFRVKDLEAIMPGYVSTEKYAVKRNQTDEDVSFHLQLITLDRPYVKDWAFRDPATIEQYRASAAAGLSFGAFEGDQIVGIAICEIEAWNQSFQIREFGVAVDYRGRGIGRDLMNAVADIAHQHRCRVLVAETQNTNMPAIRFYRALDFEIDGLDLSLYAADDTGEIALFMKRKV